MSGNEWMRSREVAATFAPANIWRDSLAQHLRVSSEAAAALVFTCPAGNLALGRGSVAPSVYQKGFESSFMTRLLPRIQRTEPLLAGCAEPLAYAPLEIARNQRLALQTHLQVVAAMGAASIVSAFLVGQEGAIIGWIAIASNDPTRLALNRIGPELTSIARIASLTLQAAIALASDCLTVITRRGPAPHLSSREQEIIDFVALGLSNRNIACRLEIAEQTVGTYLRRIFDKLGVHSRIELAPFANSRS